MNDIFNSEPQNPHETSARDLNKGRRTHASDPVFYERSEKLTPVTFFELDGHLAVEMQQAAVVAQVMDVLSRPKGN